MVRWLWILALATPAYAQPKDCLAELDARHVSYKRATRPGIALAVEVTGPLGGVTYASEDQPAVFDCSLAVSLDEAGRYMTALGIERAQFVSAYAQRNVHGTNRPSKHSFGLAIDITAFSGKADTLRIAADYESGLGDDMDCIGAPTTRAARTLKTLQCQLVRSGLFHLVLSPDYDDDHRDHFHLEVTPWRERRAIHGSLPAIH